MELSADFFDSIQIDVVKRKYYNANKVNAVFEEIREQVLELLEENERLKKELSGQKKADEGMLSLPQVYRETLQKGRERAAAMEREVQAEGERLRQEYEARQKKSDELLADCIRGLRIREEENLSFLDRKMREFRAQYPMNDCSTDDGLSAEPAEEYPGEELTETEPDLDELERRIGLLANEIRALEDKQPGGDC